VRAAGGGYAVAMLAANVFHWWLGIILFGVGVLASLSLLAGYIKKVVLPQYPGKHTRQRED
jgi:membrane protein implicated in regulation of membrane protease activity